jgi:hypothetical protein
MKHLYVIACRLQRSCCAWLSMFNVWTSTCGVEAPSHSQKSQAKLHLIQSLPLKTARCVQKRSGVGGRGTAWVQQPWQCTSGCTLISAMCPQVEGAAREVVPQRQAEEEAAARATSPSLEEHSHGAAVVGAIGKNGKRGRSQRESLEHAQQSYSSEEDRQPADKRRRLTSPPAEAPLG